MDAPDLFWKALILTFEGAGLGIGPKAWKDGRWCKRVHILKILVFWGNLRDTLEKFEKNSFWNLVFRVWKMLPTPVGVF